MNVLPRDLFTLFPWQQYLKIHFAALCEVLEPVLNAKTKDEIAQTLLKILQHSGKAKEFLCDIVMAEVQHVGKNQMIFIIIIIIIIIIISSSSSSSSSNSSSIIIITIIIIIIY